nr:MAG TPA: hypothetical protein [Caudoviricetes sp.]
MTKQEEIEVLQSLKGDTYFAQKFGADIDTMCENIKNDFAIECGCTFNRETEVLRKEMENVKTAAKDMITNFAHKIIVSLNKGNDTDVMCYQAVEEIIGIEEIIKFKYSQNIELDESEIKYLVESLDKR